MEQDRSPLHSGLGGNLFDAQKAFMFSCPYLGTLEDTDTSLSYPSPANHCFRTKTPASIDLPHQENYCLTDMHPGCHIFHQSVSTSPAVKKRKRAADPRKRTQRISIYALPLILILIFMAAILWWPAPGTTFQEAIAFGAQLRGSKDTAAANASQSDSPTEDQLAPAVTGEQTPETDQQAGDGQPLPAAAPGSQEEPSGSTLTEAETAQAGAEDEAEAPHPETAGENSPSASQTAQEKPAQAKPPAAEATEEESEASSSADIEEAASTTEAARSSSVVDESVEGEAAASRENSEEIDEAAAEAAVDQQATTVDNEEAADSEQSSETSEVSDDQESEALALLVSGLPVIDTLQTTQNPSFDQAAAESTFDGRAAFIGPDANTPLALNNDNNDQRPLFVRETPSLVGKLLTIINRRQQATVLGRDSSATWLKVRLETGVEGWVNAQASKAAVDLNTLPVVDQLSAPAAQPPAASTVNELPVLRQAIVNTGALNIRTGPGLAYEPITIINKGEVVGLVGRSGGVWVKIRLDSGLEGWVNATLLTAP